MRSSENIEKHIKNNKLHVCSSSQMDEKILGDSFDAMEQAMQKKQAENRPGIWRNIMRSRISKLAVAAIIIVAALIGINQFGGSVDITSVAFADVLENISNTGSVVYKERYESEKNNFTNLKMVNQDGVMRIELDYGGVLIIDFDNGLQLSLQPQSQTAERDIKKPRKIKAKGFSYIGWLRKLHEGEAIFDRQEEVDGYITNVYVWQVPFEKITVWVDPESNLPVKVERLNLPNTEKNVVMPTLSVSEGDFGGDENISAGGSISSGRGSGLGITEKQTQTMFDFQWDVELDASLFSLDPPEGYTLEERYLEESPVDENSLIHILGFWANMNDGIFPTVEQINDPEAFKPHIIAQYDKDGDPKEEFDLARDEVSRILKGIYVVQEKKVSGTWGYAGEDVLLGEAERIVCWWFDEAAQAYKAVFGDLSIGEIAEDQLPIEP